MPPPIISTQDGSHTCVSDAFGVTYHSKFGALTESEHVFIQAGLRHQARLGAISVLEAGFGTGLNAFMTWLEADKRGLSVQYLGLEIAPLPVETAMSLNYPGELQVPHRAADFIRLHTLPWDVPVTLSEHFTFEKRRCRIQDFVSGPAYDVVYFDAFAPQIQPELWTPDVMSHMFAALRPQGILVTYCAQGAFRRSLRAAGFKVERLPGTVGKWEMTRATKPTDVSKV